ncbi:MAG: hypothetical protein FJZ98_02495 [Chloroflexi bacterium]|nr:hypothetical protein [Chloroflexota bacterium]
MKKYSTLILFVILVVISSCTKQASGDPADAAFRYLSALADKDKTTLVNFSCKGWEEQATLEADALLSVGVALNNVSCQVTGEDGDYQLVNCTGKLDLTYGEEVRSIDLGLRTYSMGFEEGQWRVCSYK